MYIVITYGSGFGAIALTPMVLGGLLYLKITLTCISQGRLWLRVVCRALGRRVRRGWHSGQLDATFPPLVLGGSLCTSLFPNVGTVKWQEKKKKKVKGVKKKKKQ